MLRQVPWKYPSGDLHHHDSSSKHIRNHAYRSTHVDRHSIGSDPNCGGYAIMEPLPNAVSRRRCDASERIAPQGLKAAFIPRRFATAEAVAYRVCGFFLKTLWCPESCFFGRLRGPAYLCLRSDQRQTM